MPSRSSNSTRQYAAMPAAAYNAGFVVRSVTSEDGEALGDALVAQRGCGRHEETPVQDLVTAAVLDQPGQVLDGPRPGRRGERGLGHLVSLAPSPAERHRPGGPVEDGSGAPYSYPRPDGREDRYFKLPYLSLIHISEP